MTSERAINLAPWESAAFAAGLKTQLRRPVVPQPEWFSNTDVPGGIEFCHPVTSGTYSLKSFAGLAPYPVGTVLWGRETFGLGWDGGDHHYYAIPPSGREKKPDKIFYRADGQFDDESQGRYCWRPSTQMPRWAARTWLTVESVRVERVQAITELDAISEGAPCVDNPDYDPDDPCDDEEQTYVAGFMRLWDVQHKRYPWASNPFCWVYGVKRR